MQLTVSEFAALLKSLRSDGRRGGERRANPRAPVRAQVDVTPIGLHDKVSDKITIMARDVSRGGFGLLMRQAFRPNARVVIALNGNEGCSHLAMLCAVARCQPLSGGQFLVGVRFVRKLTDAQHRRLDIGDAAVLVDLMSIPDDKAAPVAA